MRSLLFALLLLVTGCGTTSSGGKPRTLNLSNLEKTPAGTYRLVKKPETQKKPLEAQKTSSKREDPYFKINWIGFVIFYAALALIAYIIWLVFNAYEQGKEKPNPFKIKK